MGIPLFLHLAGEDAIRGELDTVPNPTDQYLFLRNVTAKDRKPLAYIDDDAQVVLFAWHKVTFLELMVDVTQSAVPGATVGGVVGAPANGKPQATTVLGFFREDE